MPNTFIKIQTLTADASGTTGFEFTNIPQTYTDLLIKLSARDDNAGGANGTTYIQFNSDTGSNYSWRRIIGNGSTATGASSSSATQMDTAIQSYASLTASLFGTGDFYIVDYTNTSAYKTISASSGYSDNASTNNMRLGAGIWNNSAAITTIKVYPVTAGKWLQYSSCDLYGIKSS